MSFSSVTLVESALAVDALGDFDDMDEATAVSAVRLLADHSRMTAALQARGAAKIARLSDPSLGLSGLARRHGFVNAESFLQAETGTTKVEATKFVQVGRLLDAVGWQGSLGKAFDAGEVSVDRVNAIRIGLGGSAATEPDLILATGKLLATAATVDPDELGRQARAVRDDLDAESIARREKQRRELRYFTMKQRDDGIVAGSFALSDEDGAMFMAVYQQATSPKNIGPRFVDSSATTVPDEKMPPDLRTRGQKAADVFAGLVRIGTETDTNTILGLHRPSVRIHVAAETIARRAGHGVIEDSNDFPVAFATVERHLCASGVIGVAFDDDGQALNVGRDQRLFTRRQRIALAARDGGCRFPGCDRPVSWTEAHHVQYWQRDDGETNLADGILLCRAHHLLIHDNHWTIKRDRGHYWLTAPPGIDHTQTPRRMPSKQPLIRELQRA